MNSVCKNGDMLKKRKTREVIDPIDQEVQRSWKENAGEAGVEEQMSLQQSQQAWMTDLKHVMWQVDHHDGHLPWDLEQ